MPWCKGFTLFQLQHEVLLSAQLPRAHSVFSGTVFPFSQATGLKTSSKNLLCCMREQPKNGELCSTFSMKELQSVCAPQMCPSPSEVDTNTHTVPVLQSSFPPFHEAAHCGFPHPTTAPEDVFCSSSGLRAAQWPNPKQRYDPLFCLHLRNEAGWLLQCI